MANRLVASPISSAVCCLALLAAASARSLPTNGTPAGNYTSNTQQCIVSSPKLEACAHLPFGGDSATWWSLGGHLLQCCSALREFNKPGCFCNPTVVASDPAIGNLTKALDVLGPLCLFDPMTKDRDNCPSSLSEPGVCGVPDIDIDAGRFQTLTTMINAENLPNQTHYREVLSQIVSPNITYLFTTSGHFDGFEQFIEYYSILNRYLNDAYLGVNNYTVVPSLTVVNETSIKVTVDVNVTFYEGKPWQAVLPHGLTTWTMSFDRCGTILKDLVLDTDDTLLFYFTRGADSAVENCFNIMKYCTGDLQQYANITECMEFWRDLRAQTCVKYVLRGNSTQCRWTHLQIVKFNPNVHCWHVGKYGGPDPDNGYRCCDSGEKCGAEVCDAILPVGPGQGGLHADRDSYFAALAEDAGFYIHEPLRVGVTDDIVAASMLDPS